MNAKIRNELGKFYIEGKLKTQLLKCFGYVSRMGDDRKVRQIMESRPERRRTRVRPRKT